MGNARKTIIAAFMAGCWAGSGTLVAPALAADVVAPAVVAPAPLPVIKPFEFSLFSYGWAAGLKGDTASLPPLPATRVDISFQKVLENFEGALMAASELKIGRLLIVTDMMYSRIGGAVNPKGPLFDRASLRTSSFIATALVGYRVIDDPVYTLDAVAGVRGYSMYTKITTSSPVPALNLIGKETEGWVDPIIGVKARVNLTPSIYLTSWALIGGFGAGSKLSWDVFGGLGYAFTEKASAVLGYRALGIDYSRNGYLYDVVQQGPLAAFVYRF